MSYMPSLRDRIVGIDRQVPLLDGSLVTYVNLDNAASTPALKDVAQAVERFLPYYSSVHRGTGFKSRLSTIAYDQAGVTPLAYAVQGMPSSYLIDSRGKVAEVEQGFHDERKETLERRIQALLAAR